MASPSTTLRELNRLTLEGDGIYREAARRLGIPSCTLWILYTMRVENQPVTQTRLCQVMCEPKTTINSALKQMAAQGLIVLAVGNDKRTRSITLTEKGIELARNTADKLLHAEEAALLSLSPEQLESMLLGLRLFNQNLAEQLDCFDSHTNYTNENQKGGNS